ncbi:hypothetical protein HWV62_6098 [Athelia sp. TMB]|nr:hypothetical protein HWV62_6098 [Athelia sp. TMB]
MEGRRASLSVSSSSSIITSLSPDHLVPSPLLNSLSDLYSSYASHFNGPVHRSLEYWQTWIRSEHSHSSTTSFPIMASILHHPSSTEPSAYLFAQRVSKEVTGDDGVEVLKEHLLVREFVCNESEMTADGGRHSFEQLVESMLDQPGMREGTEMVVLKVALPIAALFKPPFPSTYNEEDQGFMYRPIENTGPVVSSQLTGEALIDKLYDGARLKHLFFATDAF